jgi:hypothetical protein
MGQRSIILYLARNGLAAVAIDEALVATLGPEMIGYSSVTRYLREAKFATSNPEVAFTGQIREHDHCDQTILLASDEQPFASIRQLAQLSHLLRTTVHWCLTQSLRFQVRHLRWVPRRLSDVQKLNWVELSRELPSGSRTKQGRHRHDLITLDESRFYLNTDHESIWLPPDAKVPCERTTYSSVGKIDIDNFWNPNGFHVSNALSKYAVALTTPPSNLLTEHLTNQRGQLLCWHFLIMNFLVLIDKYLRSLSASADYVCERNG